MKSISVGPFSKVYYFHYDLLGSITNLTDSSGTTMWTDSYEPYGLIHSETKNSTQAPTAVIKFAGEYLDPTGLYHLRARQYDPSSGRFTTLDPLPNPTTDPYMSAYTYDRPTVLTDPSGMRSGTCTSPWCWYKQDPLAGCLAGVGLGVAVSVVSAGTLTGAAAVKAGEGCGESIALYGAERGLEHIIGSKQASDTGTVVDIYKTGTDVTDAVVTRADRIAQAKNAVRVTIRAIVVVIR